MSIRVGKGHKKGNVVYPFVSSLCSFGTVNNFMILRWYVAREQKHRRQFLRAPSRFGQTESKDIESTCSSPTDQPSKEFTRHGGSMSIGETSRLSEATAPGLRCNGKVQEVTGNCGKLWELKLRHEVLSA